MQPYEAHVDVTCIGMISSSVKIVLLPRVEVEGGVSWFEGGCCECSVYRIEV